MRFFSESSGREKLGQGGFSLVEAMVAIVIFAIGILGAYKMQLNAVHTNALANRVSTATSWAGYAIEGILGKPYDDVDLLDNGKSDTITPSGTNDVGWDGIDVMDRDADGELYIQPDGSAETDPTDNDLYSIFWNIVEGDPTDIKKDMVLKDAKLIRVHVIRNGGIGNGHLYSHDYFKARYPESPE